MTPARPSPSRPAGFSLFEVVIALSILALLAGTLFGIVWKAADAAGEIRAYDTRDEEVARFLALMRQTVESLPGGATLSLAPPEETASGFPELTISGAPSAFIFGERHLGAGDTLIGLRPQTAPSRDPAFAGDDAGGATLWEIAISLEDFAPRDTDGSGMVFRSGGDNPFLQADSEGRYWMTLLDEVTGLGWRYWDADRAEWIDRWEDTERLPALLEMSLDDRYRPAPLRLVLEVPAHLSSPPQQAEAASGGSDAGGTSSVSPAPDGRPGGGAAGPGGGQGGPPGAGGPPRGGRPDGSRPPRGGTGEGGPGGPGGPGGGETGGPGGGRGGPGGSGGGGPPGGGGSGGGGGNR